MLLVERRTRILFLVFGFKSWLLLVGLVLWWVLVLDTERAFECGGRLFESRQSLGSGPLVHWRHCLLGSIWPGGKAVGLEIDGTNLLLYNSVFIKLSNSYLLLSLFDNKESFFYFIISIIIHLRLGCDPPPCRRFFFESKFETSRFSGLLIIF